MPVIIALVSKSVIYAQTPFRWDGGAGTPNWNDANNWNPNTVPGSGNVVILDNTYVTGTYTVKLPNSAVTVASIEITPGAGTHTITLELPSTNTQNPGLTISASGDALVINDRGIFKNSSGATSGSGFTISLGLVKLNAGGTYHHNTGRAHSTNFDKFTFAATSNVIFEVPGSGAYAISLPGRNYGNLTLTAPRTYSGGGITNPVTVNGNLTIEAGTTFSPTLDNNIIIKGNLVINGTFSWNPSNASGIKNLVFNGTNQTISGSGTWTVGANIDNINIQSNTTLNFNLTLNSGNALDIDNGGVFKIASGKCLTATNGSIINDGTLSIENGGSLLPPASLSGSGTYTMTRPGQTGNAYTFWSSPIAGQNVSVLGNVVYQYNETTNSANYRDDYAPASGTMQFGVGYAALGSGTVTFSGTTLNVSNVTKTLTATGTASDPQNGWNLLGNPFPAAIKVTNFFASNPGKLETNAVYLWSDDNSGGSGYTSADFAVMNPLGTAGGGMVTPAGYIPACQGFFVKAASNGVTVDLKRTDLQCTNDQFFRTEAHRIRLVLSSGKKRISSTMIGFVEDATEGFDSQYDAPAFGSSAFATLLNGRPYVIQGLPAVQIARTVALRANFAQGGSFSITPDIFELPEGYTAILEDKSGFVKVDLSQVKSYEFEAAAGQADGRFFLHFVPLSGQEVTALTPTERDFGYQIERDQIAVRFDEPVSSDIEILDLSGRIVYSHSSNEQQFTLFTGLNGLYIMRVRHDKGIHSVKILLGQ